METFAMGGNNWPRSYTPRREYLSQMPNRRERWVLAVLVWAVAVTALLIFLAVHK